jgi:hypothetical protein
MGLHVASNGARGESRLCERNRLFARPRAITFVSSFSPRATAAGWSHQRNFGLHGQRGAHFDILTAKFVADSAPLPGTD